MAGHEQASSKSLSSVRESIGAVRLTTDIASCLPKEQPLLSTNIGPTVAKSLSSLRESIGAVRLTTDIASCLPKEQPLLSTNIGPAVAKSLSSLRELIGSVRPTADIAGYLPTEQPLFTASNGCAFQSFNWLKEPLFEGAHQEIGNNAPFRPTIGIANKAAWESGESATLDSNAIKSAATSLVCENLTVITTLDSQIAACREGKSISVCGVYEKSGVLIVCGQHVQAFSYSSSYAKQVDDAIVHLYETARGSHCEVDSIESRSALMQNIFRTVLAQYESITSSITCCLGWLFAPHKAIAVKHEEAKRFKRGLELIHLNNVADRVAIKEDGMAMLEDGSQVDIPAGQLVQILDSQDRRCKIGWETDGKYLVGFVNSRLVEKRPYAFICILFILSTWFTIYTLGYCQSAQKLIKESIYSLIK